MNKKEEIGKRIQEFFNKGSWKKKEFSELLGVLPQHLNKVFSGKLDPLNYIDKLGELGADQFYLITGKKSNNPSEIFNTAYRAEYDIGEPWQIDKLYEKNRTLESENRKLKDVIRKMRDILKTIEAKI